MRKFIGRILIGFCVILLTVTFSDSQGANKKREITCTEKNDLTADEINVMLNGHNTERASLKIPDLVWDCKLAKLAQEWATRGVFEHRPQSALGENMFVSLDPSAPVTQCLDRWMEEKKFYNAAKSSCIEGKACGHYTQMVATTSQRIGCGINRKTAGRWKLLMVCNYDPAGNQEFVHLLFRPRAPFRELMITGS